MNHGHPTVLHGKRPHEEAEPAERGEFPHWHCPSCKRPHYGAPDRDIDTRFDCRCGRPVRGETARSGRVHHTPRTFEEAPREYDVIDRSDWVPVSVLRSNTALARRGLCVCDELPGAHKHA